MKNEVQYSKLSSTDLVIVMTLGFDNHEDVQIDTKQDLVTNHHKLLKAN